jgi:alanine dehydrogenase
MLIGIPKEIKKGEKRVALIPEHVKVLVSKGHKVRLERDAGAGCKFSDYDYRKAGARIVKNVDDCEMIVKVKEPSSDRIRHNQIIMGYLHIEKGQNMPLLKQLLDKNVTSYAYEEIRDDNGNRLVNLGVEAGIVGMYEGLRLYGRLMEKNSMDNQFKNLKPIKEYFSVDEIYRSLENAGLHNGVKVYIFGKGRVSYGAQKILKYSKIIPNVLYRDKTRFITNYLPEADIIVNAVDWYPDEPHIITKDMLKLMKKTAIIVDISCDAGGAIQSCIPTNWDNPTYEVNGITHYCVDNLPSAIPRDASIHLSNMIIDSVLAVADGDVLETGLMTSEGVFEYMKEKGKLAEFEEHFFNYVDESA